MTGVKDALLGDRPFYPRAPGYKEPTTSRDAAAAMASKSVALRQRVLAAIAAAASGLTADQAAEKVGESVLAIRPRVTELAKTGKIIATGERRMNESRLMAKVWRAA